jgi:DNA-binding transcriptional regulator YdaS (Cro superfamily)
MIGVSQQAVSRWVLKGKSLPAEYVEAVSLATHIPMRDLRPDLPFGEETSTALPALPPISTIDEVAP